MYAEWTCVCIHARVVDALIAFARQARVKMYRQMQEDIERKRHLVEEDKKRLEVTRQQEIERNERYL